MRQRPGREWLDEDQGSAADVRASLADLAWIHRALGGEAAMERLLAAWWRQAEESGSLSLAGVGSSPAYGRVGGSHAGEAGDPVRPSLAAARPAFRVLDVGAGGGAGTAALLAWFRARGCPARLTAMDRRASHLAAGRPWPAGVDLAAGDVFAPPFPERSFDLVIASLLLHHFHGAAAVALLHQLAALSRGAVVIHDLERGWLGYAGFSVVAALRCHPMTRHDGRLSFRQAYTRPEVEALARAAGFSRYQVQSVGRFRFGLTIWRNGESKHG